MPGKAKILVIRFSAMGDVAMTVPVLKELTQHYPDLALVIVTRPLFKPFFADLINSSFHAFDPKKQHKGFWGIFKLFLELRSQNVTAVADLHNNLRSKILRTLFFLSGVRSVSLDKGRREKKWLTRKADKLLIPLKLTVQRYAVVFERLGFPFQLSNAIDPAAREREQKWIGVSPFAQHLQKVYPLHKMESVVLSLAGLGHRLFIFGGTPEEQQTAETWASKHPNVVSMVRKVSLEEELRLISELDVMLSMDSSGMHLASLKNIPVVSVWGATHPFVGFLGYGQSLSDAVQIPLYCRPCSVYGNVPCYRGDHACMNSLPENMVIEKVLERLNFKKETL